MRSRMSAQWMARGAHLVMTHRPPRTRTTANSTLIENVSELLWIGVEGEWSSDHGRRDGHFEWTPCFPSVLGSVVCFVFRQNKGLTDEGSESSQE